MMIAAANRAAAMNRTTAYDVADPRPARDMKPTSIRLISGTAAEVVLRPRSGPGPMVFGREDRQVEVKQTEADAPSYQGQSRP